MTPDIIGELEKAIGEAADAKRLPMGKDEALKAFRTTAVELELPIIAEVPDRYAESPSPTTPQYTEPSVINNYYYTEGPPVVTYYPPHQIITICMPGFPAHSGAPDSTSLGSIYSMISTELFL